MPHWFVEGGVVMYLLLIYSVAALAIIMERFYALYAINKEDAQFLAKVKKVIASGKTEEAEGICFSSSAPIASIFKAGLGRHTSSKEEIEKAMEDEASHQVPLLEKYLKGLAIIANISPLTGFLGTVTGLYGAFRAIVLAGGVTSTSVVAQGISQALVTTVTGLTIAIPVLIFHGYFVSRVEGMVLKMERECSELIKLLGK